MSINFVQLAPILAATTTIGGLIFQLGKHSEKLDIIGFKVEAQGKKEEHLNQACNDIKSSIQSLQKDISYIKEDIHDIKGTIHQSS
jgi:peptidoglycan hydrolase CwlO-like protein